MIQEYLLSIDGGKNSKGPFKIEEIESMYLNNRIPETSCISPNNEINWILISTHNPDLANNRSNYHTEINAAIEFSEKLAIAEEKGGIWGGLIMFFIGLLVTVFTYKFAIDSPSPRTYVIAYGPILTGLFAFLVGLVSTIQRKLAKQRQQQSDSVDA